MTKQILAFLFCFIRELNLYSPLTLTLTSAHELKPLLPPYPHPHLRARTQTFTPLLHPSLRQKHGARLSKKFHYNTKEVVTTKPTQVNLLNVRMYYTVRLNILPMGNIVVLDIKASENIL